MSAPQIHLFQPHVLTGMWLDDPQAPVVMGYMIDQENSDEILAVRLAANGQFIFVDWES